MAYLLLIFSCCLTTILNSIQAISYYSIITAIVLAVIVFFLALLTGYLFVFHLYLISTGQTTNEYNKMRKIESLNQGVFGNCVRVFCSPLTPSFEGYDLGRVLRKIKKMKRDKEDQLSVFNIDFDINEADLSKENILDPIRLGNITITNQSYVSRTNALSKVISLAKKTADSPSIYL